MEQVLKALESLDFPRIITAVVVLVVCLAISRVIVKIAGNAMYKINAIDAALHTILRTTLKCILYFISFIAAAGAMGIPVTSFLALFSVVGLAVSLAIQGVLTNLAGGLIILASKPFTLNDFIELDGIIGTVKDIGILHTRLLSPEGKMIFLPNDLLQSSRLINYTASGYRRVEVLVNVSYDSQPEDVRAAAMEVIDTLPHVMTDPAPMVLLEKYGPYAITYKIWVCVPSADFLTSRYALNENIRTALLRHGVEMVRPQLNIRMNP